MKYNSRTAHRIAVCVAIVGTGAYFVLGNVSYSHSTAWSLIGALYITCRLSLWIGWKVLNILSRVFRRFRVSSEDERNQLKTDNTTLPHVEKLSEAKRKPWYKRRVFWVLVAIGLICFLTLAVILTPPDEETAGSHSFGSSSKTTTVEGIVLDKLTTAPISGATIKCLKDGTSVQETVADEEGNFSMADIPKDAILQVKAQDYESAEFQVPTEVKNTVWKFELTKTPEATAEIIANSFLHGAYEDIYPYLEPDIQQKYSKDTYVKSFSNILSKFTSAGSIPEDAQITKLNRVSENEVRVLATITFRNLKIKATLPVYFNFTLKKAQDGTWRSNWPVPKSSN